MALQAIVEFPGIRQVLSASITMQHGISSGSHRITIAPQATPLALSGPLVLRFGSAVIRLEDCRLDRSSFQFDDAGLLVSLVVLDRRWRWQFGQISGQYNVIRPDGTHISWDRIRQIDFLGDTLRNPHELAELLLKAMDEHDADVAALPTEPRPLIDWQVSNPAQELERMAEQFGCRVVLKLNGKLRIVTIGEGGQLPTQPLIGAVAAVNPPEKPKTLVVATAPKIFQYDMELEAVGQDLNGTVRPIAKLSYAPAPGTPTGGWDLHSDIDFMSHVTKKARELAKRSVFRWYRVKPVFTVGAQQHEVLSLDQILPISSVQVQTKRRDGIEQPKPASVYGLWYSGVIGMNVNTGANLKPDPEDEDTDFTITQFSLDEERGIAQFNSPIYLLDIFDHAAPADLRLRTSFSLRVPKTREWIRETFKRNIGGDRGELWLAVDELIPVVFPRWAKDAFHVERWVDNHRLLQQPAEHYLDALEKQVTQTEHTEAATYAGILPIELDGAIQSVSWDIGPDGAFTRVQRGQDAGTPETVPYSLLRAWRTVRDHERALRDLRRISRSEGKPKGWKSAMKW